MAIFKLSPELKAINDKIRALKHITKALNEVEKKGSHIIRIGCTGVEWEMKVGDVHYYKYKTLQAKLAEDLNAYQITQKKSIALPAKAPATRKKIPAPVGAAPETEKAKRKYPAYSEERRAKHSEAMREYWRKRKAIEVSPTP